MIAAWLAWLSQGLALALVLGAAVRLFPRMNASTRCALWWVLLVTIGAMGAPIDRPSHLSHVAPSSPLLLIPSPPDPLPAIVGAAWAAIALLCFLRVLSGVRAICAMRRRCHPLSLHIEEQLPLWLSVRSRGRRAHLVVSDGLTGATVLGFRHPWIALPSFLVEALTPNELDQVVLHEYAHVRRWDDWTRLAQTVLHSALWMHPAAALASRHLNLEREVACDEWVVARTGQAKAYARCLASAAEARSKYAVSGFGQGVANLAGPALFGREGELNRRIDRLLAINRSTPPTVSMWKAVGGSCAILVIALQLRALPVVAEVSEIGWLPVPRPPVTRISAHAALRPPQVELLPDVPSARVRQAGLERQDPPYEQDVDRRSGLEPQDPPDIDIPVLAARTYDGGYVAPPAATLEAGRDHGWGTAGMAIGIAGRKTGVGIAALFTRAGASVARRF